MHESNAIELPPEVQVALEQYGARPASAGITEQLKQLSQAIIEKRQKFIDGRRISGIEEIWRKAEDNFDGVDDTNQGKSIRPKRWTKSPTLAGSIQSNEDSKPSRKSSAFERLTARYVAAGTAKISEIIFAPGSRPFSCSPTPVPELLHAQEDPTQVVLDGIPLQRDPKPNELAPPNPADPLAPPAGPANVNPAQLPGKPLTVKDLAEETLKKATDAAKQAEDQIYDWLIEAHYHREYRRALFDSGKVGTGVVKAPFPEIRKTRRVSRLKSGGLAALEYQESVKPAIERKSVWNIYSDPECGENHQNGSGIFECDSISESQLRELVGTPGYIEAAIQKCLTEGPEQSWLTEPKDSQRKETTFPIWYYYGRITKAEAACLNQSMAIGGSPLREVEGLSIQMTLVNDEVICATENPSPSGRYPYQLIPWEYRDGSCFGIGIAEQVFMPQELVNAATREMVNNGAVSPQIVVDRGAVIPADGSYDLYAYKVWYVSPDAYSRDLKQIFGVYEIANYTPQFLSIIQHAYQVAENSTNIPLISQGQTGPLTPQTARGADIQNTNANQLLRDVAARVDAYGNEPLIEELYDWLLLDPEVPDSAKGDVRIKVDGSVTAVNQHLKEQAVLQEVHMVLNPSFKINPARWYAKRWSKLHKMDPTEVQFTPEEEQQLAQAPPPEAPAVTAAKIRAGVEMEKAKLDTDRDRAYVQAETDRTMAEHQARMQELQVTSQIALQKAHIEMEKIKVEMEKIKADIAETSMKLRVQKEISHSDHVQETMTPPTEPPGQAEPGKAFQQ